MVATDLWRHGGYRSLEDLGAWWLQISGGLRGMVATDLFLLHCILVCISFQTFQKGLNCLTDVRTKALRMFPSRPTICALLLTLLGHALLNEQFPLSATNGAISDTIHCVEKSVSFGDFKRSILYHFRYHVLLSISYM